MDQQLLTLEAVEAVRSMVMQNLVDQVELEAVVEEEELLLQELLTD